MIELTCPKCGKDFERRGAKRGGKPYCNECKAQSSVSSSSSGAGESVSTNGL
jgi:predicted amidophosphoribosyltransferase